MEGQIDMISICCPSRGRASLADRMINTIYKTVSNRDNVEILLYLNEDDATLDEYKTKISKKHYTVGPDQSTCLSWNQLAERAQGDIVMLAGDDIQFLTKDWDLEVERVCDLFDDKICMIVPWDDNGKSKGYQHKGKTVPVFVGEETIGAPHFFVHKNWIKTLGYLAPPFFWHWYVDAYTKEVSQKLGRCVLLPHIHVEAVKIFDTTGTRVRKHLNINVRDDYVWKKVKDRHLNADVQILQQFINNYRKD